MGKREEFNSALKDALKSKDQIAMATIRLMIAAMKDRDIAARGQGSASEGISDNEILSMLQTMIKQRQESSKTYRDASRDDLADREEAEIEVIQRFMPKALSEDEMQEAIATIITETGAAGIKDMGKVMAELKTRYAGQLDMGRAGGVVKQKLAG
ncbi:MAG: GatB/YqeY domain-containing protein [Rhodospirillales bacterium]|nr:GatB/YqeY domain-containing protein [Rhodospirillales bacterium]